MAHRLVDAPHAPSNDEPPVPLSPEQVLEILLGVVPHMPLESQISFFAMSHGNPSGPPSHEAPTTHIRPIRPPFTLDVLRGVIRAKAAQQLCESDSAFEAKQRAAENASKRSGGSRGITKRYGKPQKNQVAGRRVLRAICPSANSHTAPGVVSWSSGDATMSGNPQGFETAASSTIFYHWSPQDLSTSVLGRHVT